MPRERKSLEDHKLAGTKPQYVLPDSDVPAGRPSFPKGISQTAKKKFKQLVAMLEARRTVTAGDQEILRLYALTFDRHERAIVNLQRDGEIVPTIVFGKNGDQITVMKPNLNLKIAETCESKMLALLTQLGLTPRTRTQVKETKAPKKAEERFPSREEAAPTQPVSDADLLESIDESKVVN
jgi:P27 family predicted phage terminase small subunit